MSSRSTNGLLIVSTVRVRLVAEGGDLRQLTGLDVQFLALETPRLALAPHPTDAKLEPELESAESAAVDRPPRPAT
jgi:hypothetical protein